MNNYNNQNYNNQNYNGYEQQQYSNNYQPQQDYPSLLIRWLALILDNIVYSVISGICFAPMFVMSILSTDSDEMGGLAIIALLFGLVGYLLVTTLYYCIMTSKMQGTLGKKICGLKVVNTETGQNLTFIQAFLRFLVHNLLGIFTIIGLAMNKEKRLVHDLAAKSIVLKK